MAVTHPSPRDRQRIYEWARDLLRAGDFYVLDTETTGLDTRAEVVQIGLLDAEGRVVFDSLVRPRSPVPAEASAIHGISNEMLQDAPTFADLYVQLSVMLAARPLIAYNMDFDWRMLLQSAALYGLPPVRTGARHCAMKNYATYRGSLRQGGGYRWFKLGEACKQERIRVQNAHTALGDCQMTLALLQKMGAG